MSDTVRFVPLVIVVPEADVETLRPLMEAKLDLCESVAATLRGRLSGWSGEMLAWGAVLGGLARLIRDGDVEVVP